MLEAVLLLGLESKWGFRAQILWASALSSAHRLVYYLLLANGLTGMVEERPEQALEAKPGPLGQELGV